MKLPDGYVIDSVTGYLEPIKSESDDAPRQITAFHKTAFLKHFRISGNRTAAITKQGFRYPELEWHLKNDAQFKADFAETLLAMRHEIEEGLFRGTMKGVNLQAQQRWLEVHFPEDYARGPAAVKAKGKGVAGKSRLDTILEDLE